MKFKKENRQIELLLRANGLKLSKAFGITMVELVLMLQCRKQRIYNFCGCFLHFLLRKFFSFFQTLLCQYARFSKYYRLKTWYLWNFGWLRKCSPYNTDLKWTLQFGLAILRCFYIMCWVDFSYWHYLFICFNCGLLSGRTNTE